MCDVLWREGERDGGRERGREADRVEKDSTC